MADLDLDILREGIADCVGEEDAALRNYILQSGIALDEDMIPSHSMHEYWNAACEADDILKRLGARYYTHQKSENAKEAAHCVEAMKNLWSTTKNFIMDPQEKTKSELTMGVILGWQVIQPFDLSAFKKPRSHKKKRLDMEPEPVEPELPLKNRFQNLTDTTEDMEQAEADETGAATPEPIPTPTAANTRQKVVPLYVNLMPEWQKLTNLIKNDVAKHPLDFKLIGESIKIQPTEIEDYRAIQNYLTENHIAFHALQLPEDRPIKVVLRGIPPNSDNSVIVGEIQENGIEVTNCVPMRSRRNGRVLPLLLLSLKPLPDWDKIYTIDRLMNLVVQFQPYRAPAIRQCYRCQRFGHSSLTCSMPPRCVKCAQGHITKECTLPKDADRKCCNCEGSHAASYRACPQNPANRGKKYSKGPRKSWNKLEKTRDSTVNPTLQRIIDAPVPSVNAWDNGPPDFTGNNKNLRKKSQTTISQLNIDSIQQKPGKHYSRNSNNTQATAAGDASSILEILKMVKELSEIVNLKGLLQALNHIKPLLSEAPTPMDKLLVLLENAELFENVLAANP